MGEGSHPERVKVYGPGVEKTGLKANEPTYFTVDCSEAGQGASRSREWGAGLGGVPAGGAAALHLFPGVGPVTCRRLWSPLNSWPRACLPSGDVSIGIKCAPGVVGPAEADIDFDIIKNDNDTFTVKYTPPGAGRYTIMVLFANQVPVLGFWLSTLTSPPYPFPTSSLRGCHLGTILLPLTEHFLCVDNVPERKQKGQDSSDTASVHPDQAFSPSRRSPPVPSISRWTHPMMPARSRQRALG